MELQTPPLYPQPKDGETFTVAYFPLVLKYHYGPTPFDPDAGKMWHDDCGGEVYGFDEGLICAKCGQSEVMR